MIKVIKVKSKDDFVEKFFEVLNFQLDKINEIESPVVGIPGGRTPLQLFPFFKERIAIYDKCRFVLVDERLIDLKNESSNFGTIERVCPDFSKKVIHFSPENPIIDFNEKLLRNNISKLDIAVLGVGNDGHFASVFPGESDHEESVVLTQTNSFEVKNRVTLSAKFISNSKHIIMIVMGSEKAELVKRILSEKFKNNEFPISYLVNSNECTLITDCLDQQF